MKKLEIEAALRKSIGAALTSHPETVGLMNGKAGYILLYAYLYQLDKREDWYDRYSTLIDESIDIIIHKSIGNSLANGITGFLWTLQHLNRLGLIEKDALGALDSLEEIIFNSIQEDRATKSYDLLSGLIGKGMYFLDKPASSATDVFRIEYIVSLLDQWSIRAAQGRTWQFSFEQETQVAVFNLGMAHGVPSIIAFLSKAYQKGIAQASIQPLLLDAVNWLLTQEKSGGYSRFPVLSDETHESRLAWCYGDLGPALALWHASLALKNMHWQKKAMEIATCAAQRRLESAHIIQNTELQYMDSGFCHGTSGLAHIFNRFFQASGLASFQTASHYWLSVNNHANHLLFPDLLNQQDGTESNWQENTSLLEGLIGKSLVYLTFIHKNKMLNWDGLFMTDIHL